MPLADSHLRTKKRKSSFFSHPSRFQSKLEFGAGLPSVDKRARLLGRLGVVGWYDVQLTRDVDLQERQGGGFISTLLKL